jgi:hypothetical protein
MKNLNLITQIYNILIVKGINTDEFTLLSAFFTSSPSTHFKVTLTITTITNNTAANATTSMIFKKDSAPANGNCSVNVTSGYSMQTYYGILCSNWTASDGIITTYEYYGIDFLLIINKSKQIKVYKYQIPILLKPLL